MSRFTLVFVSAVALFGSTASALPQAGAGSGGSRATTVRARCVRCPSSRDSSTRERQEQLLLRIDSLKRILDSARLSDSERELAAREITRTVDALQALLDETMRADVAVVAGAGGGPVARAGGIGGAGPRMAVVVQGFQPRGYLGITFEAPNEDYVRDNERFIRFYRYPRIAMVESSSPAERAGVREGDTLLALNGTDVKNEVFNLTKLLVPQARLIIRVRRDGDSKDLRVTVREAPEYYAWRATAMPRTVLPPMPAEGPVRVQVQEAPMPPAIFRSTPAPPARVWVTNEGIAGAHVATVTEGLSRTIGAKEGVLVIQVQPGTPAYRSGLRDGDVILSADGRSVTTVQALRRVLVEGDGDEGVKLVILRERKPKDVTLRW